jgi:hypothetical protein
MITISTTRPSTPRGVSLGCRRLASRKTAAAIALTLAICVPVAPSRTTAGGIQQRSCSVPLAYDVPTDRLPRALPPLPALGPAGSRIIDPTFHTNIVRVTDAATRPDRPNRAFHTPSSSEANSWNLDSTIFYVTGGGGEAIPFRFDPSTMRVSRFGTGTGPSGGSILPFGGEPTFSYENKYLIYGMGGAADSLLQEYNFQTGSLMTLLDIAKIVSGFSGGYVGGVSNSVEGRFNVYFGGSAQDQATYVLVWNRKTNVIQILDTSAGTLNGKSNLDINWGWRVHNSRIDKSGRFVVISAASGPYALISWDLNTNKLAPIEAKGGGHKTSGFGYMINNDGYKDGSQWLLRALSGAGAFTKLIAHELTPTEWVLDTHISWNNAQRDAMAPVFVSTYHPSASDLPGRAWDDEIIAVQTDGKGSSVWRFAHHRSKYTSFWDSPRGNVSQDGCFYMFTSNWDTTVGNGRQDAFIVGLPSQACVAVHPTGSQ